MTYAETQATHGRILDAIRAYQQTCGYAPSVRDLAAALSMSMGALTHHLKRMKAAGLVAWEPGKARSLRVVEPGIRTVTKYACAVCGQPKRPEDYYVTHGTRMKLCKACHAERVVARRAQRIAEDPVYHEALKRSARARYYRRKEQAR